MTKLYHYLKATPGVYLLLICILFAFSSCGYIYDRQHGYRKKGGKIYYTYAQFWNQVLPFYSIEKSELIDADIKTFKVCEENRHFATDKNHVYWRMRILDMDPETFKVFKGESYEHSIYMLDKSGVYYIEAIYRTDTLFNADPKTFEVFGHHYSKDSNTLFFHNSIAHFIENPKGFELVDKKRGKWVRDGINYYYMEKKVDGIDYATLKVLNKNYFKDKDHVFYIFYDDSISVIEGADAKTFKALNKSLSKGVAQDCNRFYIGNEEATEEEVNKINVSDPAIFKYIFGTDF